jgi:diadenosine tetraphosphatase ApaH/serine/threonine PP2A family protein phosphatase
MEICMEEAIAIVSDIHANLEALKAVHKDIKTLGIKEIHGLGDTVGYGPNPVECFRIAQKFDVLLMGNHEEAACFLDNAIVDAICKEHSAIPVKWIREVVFRTANEGIFESMRTLPAINLPNKNDLQRKIAEVHGTLCLDANEEDIEYHRFIHQGRQPHDAVACASINRYSSTNPEKDNENLKRSFDSLARLERKVCFVGHVHCTEAFEYMPQTKDIIGYELNFGSDFKVKSEAQITLDEENLYVINPGSIGQPRDGDPRASYCIFTGDKVIIRKVPYDRRTTMLKLLAKSFLPDDAATYIASRLQNAR